MITRQKNNRRLVADHSQLPTSPGGSVQISGLMPFQRRNVLQIGNLKNTVSWIFRPFVNFEPRGRGCFGLRLDIDGWNNQGMVLIWNWLWFLDNTQYYAFTLLLYSLIRLFSSVDTNTRSLGEAGLSCSCIGLEWGIEFWVTLGIRKRKL